MTLRKMWPKQWRSEQTHHNCSWCLHLILLFSTHFSGWCIDHVLYTGVHFTFHSFSFPGQNMEKIIPRQDACMRPQEVALEVKIPMVAKRPMQAKIKTSVVRNKKGLCALQAQPRWPKGKTEQKKKACDTKQAWPQTKRHCPGISL